MVKPASPARYGMASKAPTLRDLEERRQTATLPATVRHMETASIDDALDVPDLLITSNLLAKAERAGKAEQSRTLPKLRSAARHVASAMEIMLRGAGSLTTGQVRAYDLIRMLSRDGRPTGLGDAFVHYGRIFKPLHLLQFISDDSVRVAYSGGASIAALARRHHVSRGAIRAATADLLPDHTAPGGQDVPAPEAPVALDMPGKVAGFLRTLNLSADERAALDNGHTVRRGQGYTLRVTATPALHRQLLDFCQPLDSTAAQRRARREYQGRVNTLNRNAGAYR